MGADVPQQQGTAGMRQLAGQCYVHSLGPCRPPRTLSPFSSTQRWRHWWCTCCAAAAAAASEQLARNARRTHAWSSRLCCAPKFTHRGCAAAASARVAALAVDTARPALCTASPARSRSGRTFIVPLLAHGASRFSGSSSSKHILQTLSLGGGGGAPPCRAGRARGAKPALGLCLDKQSCLHTIDKGLTGGTGLCASRGPFAHLPLLSQLRPSSATPWAVCGWLGLEGHQLLLLRLHGVTSRGPHPRCECFEIDNNLANCADQEGASGNPQEARLRCLHNP